MTIQVLIYSTLLALSLSFVLGLCRLSKYRIIRGISYIFVEFFRGTSLLVQLFWLYFVFPLWLGIDLPKMAAGVLAIGLNFAAYGSEIVRSSILAVPKGQTEACIALNLTPSQRMVRVIIPQALLRMLPPFGNLQIELLKSTSLVYFIGLPDIFYQTYNQMNNYLYLLIPIFTVLLIIYFLLSLITASSYRWLERRLSAGRLS